MNNHDIDKAYISPYDKFFCEFDKDHPLSESQLIEIAKYKRIFELRDHKAPGDGADEIWKEF